MPARQRGTIDTTVPGGSINLRNPGAGRRSSRAAAAPETPAEAPSLDREILEAMTKAQLLELAADRGVTVSAKDNKAKLVDAFLV